MEQGVNLGMQHKIKAIIAPPVRSFHFPHRSQIGLLLFLSLILLSVALYAQTATGVISGRVQTEAGAPISNVTVRATIFEGPHWRKDATTNENGYYEISGLEPENYLVKTVNDQGFVDEYYNDVINKTDASTVKVNLAGRVENINFTLGRGGYLHGRVRDYGTDELLPDIEIQFINSQTNEHSGITLTDSEGVYLSPALRPGNYVIKAFGVLHGYMPVYWPNAVEVRNALPVEVIDDDIRRNQNFRLQTGGTISGTVYEDGSKLGIDSAWVVVLDSNEAWVSQAWTKNGGQYTAGGLRTGNYKVWIYEVNPWKYRAEYYQDASNFRQATWIPVTVRQTTPGIDLFLEKVSTARVRNEFIEIAVTDKYPGTNLTIGTTGGLETPLDDNQSLLNGHPYPIMSYTTIRIDNLNYRFSSKEGNAISPPTLAPDGKGIVRTWEARQIEVIQTTRLVVSEWASQPREDTALLEYLLINRDSRPHEVGLRILFDTKLGETDGAPIDIPYYGESNFERDFVESMPPWWTAKSIENNQITFSAQGTLQDFGATVPDRFVIGRYQKIMPHKWDYTVEPGEVYTSDSAVAMWWFPRFIAPGESLRIATYYGLGEDSPDLEAPEIVQYFPDKNATNVNPATPIQFLIEDKKSGVDTTQIEIFINDEPARWQTEGSLRQLTVRCQPARPLQYNQIVHVQIRNLQDNAPVPNKRSPEPDDYTFTTIWDSLPPVTQLHQPVRGGREIALHSMISVVIRDSLTGVDAKSIQFRLDNQPVPYEISGTPRDYRISHQPNVDFGFNERHTVAIDAADLAPTPNVMPTDQYNFYTLVDTLAPKVISVTPEADAVGVSIYTPIVIVLEDQPAGVDTNSIWMTVAGDTVSPKLSGNLQRLTLTYVPKNPFPYNAMIPVELNAGDLSGRKNQRVMFRSQFRTQIRVVNDSQPPYIVAVEPPDGATNVSPQKGILVTLADDSAGVDTSSIRLWINSNVVKPKFGGNPLHSTVTFQPDLPFAFGTIVKVAIEAADLANPPNQMARFEWEFTILPDHEPPFITDLYPPPGATSVVLNARIQCNVQDRLAGVNLDSLFLSVNQKQVNYSVSGDSGNYLIFYQPEIPWQHEQTIQVEVRAQDLASPSNRAEPIAWSFTTSAVLDSVPPFTTNHFPARGATQISPQTPVQVHIKDLASGVDSSSIEFVVNDIHVIPKISGNPQEYQVNYQLPDGFEYNQIVQVRLNARDYAGNPMPEDQYGFSIIVDHAPPYLTDLHPGENALNVAPDMIPSFYVRDQISGVNPKSIQVETDGVPATLEISPDPNNGYFVRYFPAANWAGGELVRVKIMATDWANNPMVPKEFSFQLSSVLPDLVIENFYTVPRSNLKMNVPFKLIAEIYARQSAVIVPFHVTFYQFTTIQKDTIIHFLPQDSLLRLGCDCQFPRGNYPMKVVVDNLDEIHESRETNNLAELMANVSEGAGNIHPNPFTPNQDGFNDRVTFDFTQMTLNQAELKLFNFDGQLIQQFNGMNQPIFTWDGNNTHGSPMPPGIYLYILADGSKTVSKGYVVLAR